MDSSERVSYILRRRNIFGFEGSHAVSARPQLKVGSREGEVLGSATCYGQRKAVKEGLHCVSSEFSY
jgi:hypothetical protein